MFDYEYIRKGGLRKKSEVIREQNELAKHYDLGWWYGTWCTKCCEVYPIFMTSDGFEHKCWYQCEVCGRKTKKFDMPWVARDAWNEGKTCVPDGQMTLFEFL